MQNVVQIPVSPVVTKEIKVTKSLSFASDTLRILGVLRWCVLSVRSQSISLGLERTGPVPLKRR